jgi:hypothetical protein
MAKKKNQYKKTVDKRQEKDKQLMLSTLKEMPIVAVACEKSGIGRTSYYRWLKEDKKFSRKSEEAINDGDRFLNDMAQSQTVSLMKDKYWPTIKYYLDNRHPNYMKNNLNRPGEVDTPSVIILHDKED